MYCFLQIFKEVCRATTAFHSSSGLHAPYIILPNIPQTKEWSTRSICLHCTVCSVFMPIYIYIYSVHWKLSDYSDFKVVYFSYLIYATVNGCNISKRVLIITYNSSCNRENILPLQLLMMAEPRKMHSSQVILFWHTKMLLSNNLLFSQVWNLYQCPIYTSISCQAYTEHTSFAVSATYV